MRILIITCSIMALTMATGVASPGAIDVPLKVTYAFEDWGDIWLGTEGDGIFVVDLDSGGMRQLVEGRGIPTNKTTCGVSAFGRIWLGSRDGLYVSDPAHREWERLGTEQIPSLSVNCLEVQDDLLWVGTQKGVARFNSRTQSWATYTKADGLSDDSILCIHSESGFVWFGTTRGGVCNLDQSLGTWRNWRREEGLVANTVFSVCASDEEVFIGTTSGLSVLDRRTGATTNYGTEALPSPSVYCALWNEDLGQAWFGTGYGIAIYNAPSGTFETITKVKEIDLERINALERMGDVIWVGRATNLWFSHRTSGIIGFDASTSSWLRPLRFDVLIDQSGYGPGDPKRFMVQSNEPIEAAGRFSVLNLAGREVYSGDLGPRFDRPDWDAYYWIGDFTDIERRGNFTISVCLDDHTAASPAFEMDNEVILQECGELIYQFLWYMRCGVAHEYRPKPCHLDDGVLPNGTHIDATGGWHCAGIWGGKWTSYHTYVLFNLLLARDLRPDFFDPIDRDEDGLPDIVNEAMWGCDYLIKMQMEDGSIHQEVEKVEETDGEIGTADDRKIFGWVPTHNGLLAVAGLAATSALARDLYPGDAARYLEAALLSFSFYRSKLVEGVGSSVEAAAMVLACVQLYRATLNGTYLGLAEDYCEESLALPFSDYRGPFVPVALVYYAELIPSTVWSAAVKDYIVELAGKRLADDRSEGNPHLPFEIPTWRLYIMDPWAAEVLFAYRLTGNRSFLEYAITLVSLLPKDAGNYPLEIREDPALLACGIVLVWCPMSFSLRRAFLVRRLRDRQ